jgi:hypothetical protein
MSTPQFKYQKIFTESGFREGLYLETLGFTGQCLAVSSTHIYKGGMNGFQANGFGQLTEILIPPNTIFDDSISPQQGEAYIQRMRARGVIYDQIATGQLKGMKIIRSYTGQYKDGYMISGQYQSPNAVYIGEFNNLEFDGLGQLQFKNSNISFKGKFDQGVIHSGTWSNLPHGIKPENVTGIYTLDAFQILFPGKTIKTHKD